MKILPAILITLFAAAPLGAAEVEGVSLGAVTLRELARMPYAAERPFVHEQRHAAPAAAVWPLTIGTTNIKTVFMSPGAFAPPPVAAGFPSSSTSFPYPPDASGAVGPHHVVDMFNNGIHVYDRKGNQLTGVGLFTFWNGPRGADDVFDTRIVYDAGSDRWVAVTASDRNLVNGGILIATSQSGDPAGTWNRYRVSVTGADADVDFPRLAVSGDRIVVTVNIWRDFPEGSAILVIDRAAAYSGAATLDVTRYDSAVPDTVPVESRDADDHVLRVARTYRASGSIALSRVTDGFANDFNIDAPIGTQNGGSSGFAICAQFGTQALMECGGDSISYAVLRNRTLWSVTTVYPTPGGLHASLVIWKVPIDLPSEATAYVIDDPARETSYGYGSIAVNKYGTALAGFAVFNESAYPAAGYVVIDAAGNMSAPSILRNGVEAYRRDRWGDYSSTVVDPADDVAFWTLQEYSATPAGTASAIWGTRWSYIPPPTHRRAARH